MKIGKIIDIAINILTKVSGIIALFPGSAKRKAERILKRKRKKNDPK